MTTPWQPGPGGNMVVPAGYTDPHNFTPGAGAFSNLNISGHLEAVPGTAPTAVAGSGAGTSPPAPVVTTGSLDNAGKITFGTGSAPAGGVLVAVTFATPWVIPGGGAPHIVAVAANSATAALQIIISGESPTGFNISTVTTPAAGQANTVYAIHYVTVG